MNKSTIQNWHEANQHFLMSAIGLVQKELERHQAGGKGNKGKVKDGWDASLAHKTLQQLAENMPSPAALDTLTTVFGLSPFERNILLMCAGMELDSTFASLCGSIQKDPSRPYPTFGLAMAALPGAHWNAIAPDAALRYWRLIDPINTELLTTNPLRIDERVLHYLTGVSNMDVRLASIVEPLTMNDDLVPSHQALAQKLVNVWLQNQGKSVLPILQLCGNDITSNRAVAAAACTTARLNLYALPAYAIPSISREITELIRLWEREALLSASALFIDCSEIETTDKPRMNAISHFCERMRAILILSTTQRSHTLRRPMLVFDVNKPTAKEQYTVWKNSLKSGTDRLNGELETMISQFNLSAHTIRAASSEVLRYPSGHDNEQPQLSDDFGAKLWLVCRAYTRPRLDGLAPRIEPISTMADIILPEPQKQTLKEIAIHVRQRSTVYDAWGFSAKSSRGLGISALFAGESGTGKTMAAEVLANELNLDLYRIDLSQVVNKYIGETEKNLKRIFDAAEEGGAILLFDEADALFGKRSEVKDSHDRYANIEVSYLLQRMETYRGLAILTTNLKSALDKAFMRRIRFIIQFPFPDAAHRAEIWRRVYPANTPTAGLEIDTLARLNVAGGSIRNIALNAAFLAAENKESVSMVHLSQAARSEYTKLEKPFSTNELIGWN